MEPVSHAITPNVPDAQETTFFGRILTIVWAVQLVEKDRMKMAHVLDFPVLLVIT